jgi:hypothetical protein
VKFTTKTESYQDTHVRDGIEAIVTKTRSVQVPLLPRDWDTIAVRGVVGLVLLLTTAAVVWSTWSIGSLLHGGVGYIAATVFDLAWAVTLVLEWMSRFDRKKRAFPRSLGWLLLIATMAVIFWHGMTLHSVPMAVTGAMVSAFAKLLWLAVMKHIDKDLSDEDAQWVEQQISAANAKMAVAAVRRQVARVEDRAAVEMLAMEASRATLHAALGVAVATPTVAVDVSTETHDAEIEEEEPLEPPTLSSLTKAEAVRVALEKRPDYTARQIVELLEEYDVTVAASYVRQVRSRDRQEADVLPIRNTQ